jgi:hypothetical protein
LPVSGGAGIPALGQERCYSPARRCSVKCWASVCLEGTVLMVPPTE